MDSDFTHHHHLHSSFDGWACYSTPPPPPQASTPASFAPYLHPASAMPSAMPSSAMPSASTPFPTPPPTATTSYTAFVAGTTTAHDGLDDDDLFGPLDVGAAAGVDADANFGLHLDLAVGMDAADATTTTTTTNHMGIDDLGGLQLYSGDATTSSPSMSAREGDPSTAHVSSYPPDAVSSYPDPVSYAAMPPVSAASGLTQPPFALPMPSYTPCPVDSDRADHAVPPDNTLTTPNAPMPPLDPNDWRARLRFCEAAPNKALLEASMVRLLDFADTMDARELAERRAANLRFDKIREQRLKDRNNEAAKRSRQRKVARIEAAEQQIAGLRRERALLVSEVASLRRRLAATTPVTTVPVTAPSSCQSGCSSSHTDKEA